ncbi:MAG: hypothetical protein FJ387_04865 [Verrucomicrobia bacterium]|nr:hypothetical protein [Verrucomicrobiota bacterium]
MEQDYFDLEDPVHLGRLEHPKLALEGLRGLVVIDEIQRRPDMFPVLRVLADRPETPARFLILGSVSRDLIRQGPETLAGRIGFTEITPFTLTTFTPLHRTERDGVPRCGTSHSTGDLLFTEVLKPEINVLGHDRGALERGRRESDHHEPHLVLQQGAQQPEFRV